MKRTAGVAMVVMAGLAAVAVMLGCGRKEEPRTGSPAAPQAQPAGVASNVQTEQTTCPVMGGKIKKTIYIDYKGRRVYFCCFQCRETFQESPEKYIKKLDEDLKAAKQGGSTEKAGEDAGKAHGDEAEGGAGHE